MKRVGNKSERKDYRVAFKTEMKPREGRGGGGKEECEEEAEVEERNVFRHLATPISLCFVLPPRRSVSLSRKDSPLASLRVGHADGLEKEPVVTGELVGSCTCC